jgi:hypothetical protein
MWPEQSGILPGLIEDTLIPPAVSLTENQKFYAGGHLASLQLLALRNDCRVTQTWKTTESTGSVTLPSA